MTHQTGRAPIPHYTVAQQFQCKILSMLKNIIDEHDERTLSRMICLDLLHGEPKDFLKRTRLEHSREVLEATRV